MFLPFEDLEREGKAASARQRQREKAERKRLWRQKRGWIDGKDEMRLSQYRKQLPQPKTQPTHIVHQCIPRVHVPRAGWVALALAWGARW